MGIEPHVATFQPKVCDYTISLAAMRECWTDAKRDRDKALAAFAARVAEDRALADAVLALAMRTLPGVLLNRVVGTERKVTWNGKDAPTQQGERLVRAMAVSLMDFPLPGGKRLRDATREDVRLAAEQFGGQARDMTVKSKWLLLVAGDLKKGERVVGTLTEARLRELRAKAEGRA